LPAYVDLVRTTCTCIHTFVIDVYTVIPFSECFQCVFVALASSQYNQFNNV
jgi:hypothetical protein